MLTLRQIEVIRAVMVTGTLGGAARLLNVAAPGLSRLMRYTEDTLGTKLFVRLGGRYVPAPEARAIFAQINEVHRNVENLKFAVEALAKGEGAELKVGATPSIGNLLAPRALADVRRKYSELSIDLDILKIEDAIDYLLLGRGEVVAMSDRLENPALDFEPLAPGRLFCVVAEAHPLAARTVISIEEIASYPLIGIEPRDPYGRIVVGLFEQAGLSYRVPIKARFGATVCALVSQNLGVAVIDEFTLANRSALGIKMIPIREPTRFQTYAAYRNDTTLSSPAEFFISALRRQMERSHRETAKGLVR
ncbi:MAG: LysR family transcriptional regulator [Hyphomicrobiales bacterium]|nr:LysR family transcriptional regulator [Hyphomicrobiales bacterium]